MSTKLKRKTLQKKKKNKKQSQSKDEDKAKRKSFLKKRMTDFKTKQKTQEH